MRFQIDLVPLERQNLATGPPASEKGKRGDGPQGDWQVATD